MGRAIPAFNKRKSGSEENGQTEKHRAREIMLAVDTTGIYCARIIIKYILKLHVFDIMNAEYFFLLFLAKLYPF
jgi:hypothetical protein